MKTKCCNTALVMCLPLILLMACQANPTPSAKVPYTVDLGAAKGATKIEVLTPDQGCSSKGHGKKGCLQCKRNKDCTIEFRLNLAPGQVGESCQATTPPDWVITKVELSPSGDSETQKGDFPKEPLPWMLDAFPGINEQDGTVYLEPDTSQATQSATIIDLNNHKYKSGTVKTAYYQVTATSCVAGIKPITIDPAIQNKGK